MWGLTSGYNQFLVTEIGAPHQDIGTQVWLQRSRYPGHAVQTWAPTPGCPDLGTEISAPRSGHRAKIWAPRPGCPDLGTQTHAFLYRSGPRHLSTQISVPRSRHRSRGAQTDVRFMCIQISVPGSRRSHLGTQTSIPRSRHRDLGTQIPTATPWHPDLDTQISAPDLRTEIWAPRSGCSGLCWVTRPRSA